MDNSNLIENTMESVRNVIFWAISDILVKSKCPDKPEYIISLKTFLVIRAYPMAPFGKEWKHLRTKELL